LPSMVIGELHFSARYIFLGDSFASRIVHQNVVVKMEIMILFIGQVKVPVLTIGRIALPIVTSRMEKFGLLTKNLGQPPNFFNFHVSL